ncbi:MAG: winged helix-turn-helix domain-containing protein [Chitinophagaceae bacterium]
MKEAVFQINERFLIDHGKNEVWDKEKDQRSRLEPRLMKLLCLLADRCGEVVTRDYIIKEIWDDYPGANEGLNQAISFLRKQLADDSKTIIKTLPKEGYIFHATISPVAENAPVSRKKAETRWPRLIAVGSLSLILLVFVFYYAGRKKSGMTATDLKIKEAAEISRIDSIHQAERMRQLNGK